MLINELITSGSMPALEAAMRFAARRQPLIASNIANIDTPNHVQVDVSPKRFQQQLQRAITARRSAGNGDGSLDLGRTSEVSQDSMGNLVLKPTTPSGNILFHDRNNRDLESLMQDQTENLVMFRLASEMLRSRGDLLRSAISERA